MTQDLYFSILCILLTSWTLHMYCIYFIQSQQAKTRKKCNLQKPPHCFPQGLKSTFFECISNGVSPKQLAFRLKKLFSKNADFSQLCLECPNVSTIFPFLAHSVEVLSNEEKRCAEKSHKKYTLLKSSRNLIRMKFNDLLKTSQPHVLIFASCFSHESEINDILRSDGLLSALTVAAERGGIRLRFEKPKIPRISPEMHMDSLTTKHFLHFALPGLWKVILPVKNRPIWPDPSQPHQIKKWSITFHRHGRAKPKYVL